MDGVIVAYCRTTFNTTKILIHISSGLDKRTELRNALAIKIYPSSDRNGALAVEKKITMFMRQGIRLSLR